MPTQDPSQNPPSHNLWTSFVVDAPSDKIVTVPPSYEVVVERGLRIPMRDGTELAAMLWRPDAPGPFPALVERSPLRLEDRTGPAGNYHAARGYAVLSVGLRGCSGSGGQFNGLIPGSPIGDGYDTIEWTAAQPWCNGRVGMICGSISGLTQYQTAVEAPPHLVAQLVREGPFSLFDKEWPGIFSLSGMQVVAVSWTKHQLKHFPPEQQAKAQALVERWQQEQQQSSDAKENGNGFDPITPMLLQLPLYPNPNFKGVADYYNEWVGLLDNPTGAMEVEPEHSVHQIHIPICHLGGWFDSLLPDVLRAFTTMQANAGTPAARAAQRLIVGPWVHGPFATHGEAVGLLEFGPNAKLDFFAFRQRWYDAHLLHATPAGVASDSGQGDLAHDPVVWLYLIGADRWLGFDSWPPPSKPATWYLYTGALSQSALLNEQVPDCYDYDPNNPVRSLTGGGAMGMGLDQRPTEDRQIIYTSEPLPEPITLAGVPKLVLYASSSAPDTDWISHLTMVRPDGASVIISGGAQRARYRRSVSEPQFLKPDKPERFDIDLLPIAIVIPAGHRLRLTVTSSDFPNIARNLNSGAPIGRERVGQIAHNQIYHDSQYPSHLILPLLTTDGSAG